MKKPAPPWSPRPFARRVPVVGCVPIADIALEEIEFWEDGLVVTIVDWRALPTDYELTFHPHAGRPLDKWRQLRAIVKRKDLKVQTRHGYRLSDERARR